MVHLKAPEKQDAKATWSRQKEVNIGGETVEMKAKTEYIELIKELFPWKD